MKYLVIVFAYILASASASYCQSDVERITKNREGVRREVAITFDDLPATYGDADLERMKSVTTKLLRSIKANNVPAIGFVNETKLYRNNEIKERTALLQMWLDAGYELGNHTYSHIAIDQVPLSAYQADVIRGEEVTRKLLAAKGMKLRYFRHTQLRTGPTPEYKKGLDQFLAARGYTIAPVTIDNNDFIFASLYGAAKMRGDAATMKLVVDAYIPYMESVFDFFERLSVDFLGYEIKQTLLLHSNDLNADHFDDLVSMMKKRGYTFITLEQALKDKAYQLPDAQVTKGLSWIHRWMIAKGLQMRPEPSEPRQITEMFEALQRSTR
jgi:peptidoglycan-N-acetylglucosamine deacetylase